MMLGRVSNLNECPPSDVVVILRDLVDPRTRAQHSAIPSMQGMTLSVETEAGRGDWDPFFKKKQPKNRKSNYLLLFWNRRQSSPKVTSVHLFRHLVLLKTQLINPFFQIKLSKFNM